jgi:hypothetical protein
MPMVREEEQLDPWTPPHARSSETVPSRPPSHRGAKIFRGVVRALIVLCLSFSSGGLLILIDQAEHSWKEAAGRLQWVVLVGGSQVEIDEVGRALKQLDGVNQVTYVSPEESLERLKADPLFSDDLSYLTGDLLPASWQVQWSVDRAALIRDEVVQDVRAVPGVLDVAFDRRTLEMVRNGRAQWLKGRNVLSLLALATLLLTLVLLGRALFLAAWRKPKKTEVLSWVFDQAWWAAGFLALYQAVAPLDWRFLAGGLVFSGLRYLLGVTGEERPGA